MRYRYFLTTTAAFLAVILTAGAWLGVASAITPGEPGVTVAILGGAFSMAFMWLLITRLRALLAHPDRRWIEAGILVVNIALLIVAYAWVHHRIGLMDFSGAVPRATRDFGDALYFSVVTLTTLGYGDMVPIGPGRIVAAMQGLTGYFVLGIIVSTGFQIIAPESRPADADPDGASGDGKGESTAHADSGGADAVDADPGRPRGDEAFADSRAEAGSPS
jgi:voltage-gated potassium channel Kch